MIASHYAEPLLRHVAQDTPLLEARQEQALTVTMLKAGDRFDMLDCSLGWAWGYGGADRRVGYIRADSLKP